MVEKTLWGKKVEKVISVAATHGRERCAVSYELNLYCTFFMTTVRSVLLLVGVPLCLSSLSPVLLTPSARVVGGIELMIT